MVYLRDFIPSVCQMLAAQNAGGGTSSQVLVKVECLHTIAEIIEKFPAAELFKYSKQLLQVLKSLLDDKKRVIRKFARTCINDLQMI